jgi:probable addiction module antidote protein
MTKTYAPFDAAAYLDNDEVVAEYLTAAAEDPNPEVFLAALGDVAKARGMAQIAKDDLGLLTRRAEKGKAITRRRRSLS